MLGSYGTGRLGLDSAVSRTSSFLFFFSCVFLDAKLKYSCKRSRGFPVICIRMLSNIFFLVGFCAVLDYLKILAVLYVFLFLALLLWLVGEEVLNYVSKFDFL
jgi:hypothetical protein